MKKKDITKKVQAYLSTFAPYLKQNDEKKEKKLNEKKWKQKVKFKIFFFKNLRMKKWWNEVKKMNPNIKNKISKASKHDAIVCNFYQNLP